MSKCSEALPPELQWKLRVLSEGGKCLESEQLGVDVSKCSVALPPELQWKLGVLSEGGKCLERGQWVNSSPPRVLV